MNIFQPALRHELPVKLALAGPSGSGKTMTALRIARGLVGPEGRIALADSEHGSALEYADQFTFDHAPMEKLGDYSPSNYATIIRYAMREGYDCLILDGISPAWNGPGGVQEIVDKNTKGGNSWSGWAVGTPEHQKLLQAILACRIHLICTMRSKSAWALEQRNGKQVPVQVGLEPVQRDGIEYEFTIVGHLDLGHNMTVSKSRRQTVPVGEVINEPGEELGAKLRSAGPLEDPVVEMIDEELRAELEKSAAAVAEPHPDPFTAPGPADPPTTPEPEPVQPAASSDPEPPADPLASSGDAVATGAELALELDNICGELAKLKPDVDWHQAVINALQKDYQTTIVDMTPEQGKALIERLKITLLREREAAGAQV